MSLWKKEQAYAFSHQKLKVYEHSTFQDDLKKAVLMMEKIWKTRSARYILMQPSPAL